MTRPAATDALDHPDGLRIACRRVRGRAPGLFFLNGFGSDFGGRKVQALEQQARSKGQSFVCFDYSSHGQSGGDRDAADAMLWLDQAERVFDAFTDGPQILVGSSMGASLMRALLQRRPQAVAGLIGIGSVARLHDTLWEGMSAAAQEQLLATGSASLQTPHSPAPYRISRALLDSAKALDAHPSLKGFRGPVRLLHGLADREVHWQQSIDLAAMLGAADCEIRLIPGGDHRLSSDADLQRLRLLVDEIGARIQGYTGDG